MPNFISEDQIERALVQKLQHLHGFDDSLDCHTEDPEDSSHRPSLDIPAPDHPMLSLP
ncbi:MAG: hypothetical protein ABR955_15150 [Verrucomicrobiota bacterium]